MKKWMRIRSLIWIGAAIGWWGLWYPELVQYAGVYTVVTEDGTVQESSEVVEYELDESFYQELFQADGTKLRFRSRLWQLAEEYLEKVRFGK